MRIFRDDVGQRNVEDYGSRMYGSVQNAMDGEYVHHIIQIAELTMKIVGS